MALLELKGVTKIFGGLTAVDSVDMVVQKGQIVGLIGPNGAGKTTLFNCIAGYYRPDTGEIWYDGTKIDGMKPHEICEKKTGENFSNSKNIKQAYSFGKCNDRSIFKR